MTSTSTPLSAPGDRQKAAPVSAAVASSSQATPVVAPDVRWPSPSPLDQWWAQVMGLREPS